MPIYSVHAYIQFLAPTYDRSQVAPDWDILLPSWLGEALDADALSEQQDVRRTAEVEHARLVSLFDMLPLLDRDFAGTDFVHADAAADPKQVSIKDADQE